MKKLSRVLLSAASAAAMFGGMTAVAPSTSALVTGCGGLCSIDGDFNGTTTTRLSPCATFGGNVCYRIDWKANVHGTSLVSGNYTATGNPDRGFNASCFFLSPAATSCSGTAGSFFEIVPPNSTTCNGITSTLVNGGVTLATDFNSRCVSVGS